MDFLYKKLWSFLERDSALPLGESIDPYRSALRLWKHFQEILTTEADREKFKSSLSEPQLKSWIILDHWWNAHYHPVKPDDNDETVIRLKAEEERQDERPGDRDRAGYQSLLSYLFVAEMVVYLRVKQLDAIPFLQLPERAQQILKQIGDKVTMARQRALKHAVWQMIGQSSYREANGTREDQRVTHLGSALESCPWLRLGGQESLRKPAYLWDREAHRSVKFEEILEENPEYFCISHTWGRWRRKEIQVKGVNWAVPTNSRFIVEDLPRIFQRLDWPVRYIWFDLFCIRQEECTEQAEEIGKQAEIFRQATCNVIWMHDVVGWKILEKCIMWLGLNYLQRNDPIDIGVKNCLDDLGEQLEKAFSPVSSDESLNPWAPASEEDSTSGTDVSFHEKNPGSWWFSSLWTLQEAYLCPSSLLVDRNWNFLSVGEKLWITLDNLASLSYGSPSDFAQEGDRPSAITVLLFTMKRWELTDLSTPSRMSLLVAAESRESTGPRAEAIMSALGVTDWFENFRKKHGKGPPQTDLVFGLYSLEFLRETQRKIGGPFFLNRRLPQNTIHDAEKGEPLGTMLPLAHNLKYWQVAQAFTFSTNDWTRSLSNDWEIKVDGSLIVREAAILYDARNESTSIEDGPVTVSSPNCYHPFNSFHAWHVQLPPVPYRFAVAVVRCNFRQFGIILEGLESPAHDGTLVLVKTAVFVTNDRWCHEDLIRPIPVHWRVL